MIRRSLSGRGRRRAAALIGFVLALPAGAAHSQRLGPLSLPNTQYEPVAWNDIEGWAEDEHAAAFTAFLKSCRPVTRSAASAEDAQTIPDGRREVCRRALREGPLADAEARAFFEQNFRPVRIAKLGENEGFLTGYYEPIVDGSRSPSDVYTVPVYRRPADLVAFGRGRPAPGAFPNKGKVGRLIGRGKLAPYLDRGEIEDGALAGKGLEICWLKDPTDLLFIQIQGSARVRLDDGKMLRIGYDGHNGWPYVPIGRILVERGLVPRNEMSMDRIREWINANPEGASELRRNNQSYVFFHELTLSAEEEAVGGQGVSLSPGRSIAIDRSIHLYGTLFFIDATLPLETARSNNRYSRLMIGQDTGSAIIGPARADIYFGAGPEAGRVAGRIRHPGRFVMLIPRELDPVAAAARMPLPLPKPAAEQISKARTAEKTKKAERPQRHPGMRRTVRSRIGTRSASQRPAAPVFERRISRPAARRFHYRIRR
jgi:membrane-bound lytic murein transglycosylase A